MQKITREILAVARTLVAKNVIYKGIPKKFWIVMEPTSTSEIFDILVETDLPKLMMMSYGGMKWDELLGAYASETDAKKHAEQLLERRDKNK